MKRITLIVPDDFDVGPLISGAIELKMERVVDDKKVTHHRPKHRDAEKTTTSVIMGHYQPGAFFEKGTAADWLEKEGFARTSVSPAISTLVKDGYLNRDPVNSKRIHFVKPLKG